MTSRWIEHHFEYAYDLFQCLSPSTGFGGPEYRPEEKWIYRGHASSWYTLLPSAFRKDVLRLEDGVWSRGPAPTQRRQIRSEIEALREFITVADPEGNTLPEDSQELRHQVSDLYRRVTTKAETHITWPPRHLWSMLAMCQHHRLPTRLLDWSLNPYLAAYFAASDALGASDDRADRRSGTSEHLAIIAMMTDLIETDRQMEWLFPGARPMDLVSAPGAQNPNLRAQRGVFLLAAPQEVELDSPFEPEPYDSLLLRTALAWETVDQPFFFKFTLPISEAGELLRLLAKEGLNAARLFPGVDGTVRAVKERRFWPEVQSWHRTAGQHCGQYIDRLIDSDPTWRQVFKRSDD